MHGGAEESLVGEGILNAKGRTLEGTLVSQGVPGPAEVEHWTRQSIGDLGSRPCKPQLKQPKYKRLSAF